VEEQKRIEARMHGELDSLKANNGEMRKKTDMLIETVEKYGKMLEAQARHQSDTDRQMEKVEAQKTPQLDIDWVVDNIETLKTPPLDIDWGVDNIEAEKTSEIDWFMDFDLEAFIKLYISSCSQINVWK